MKLACSTLFALAALATISAQAAKPAEPDRWPGDPSNAFEPGR